MLISAEQLQRTALPYALWLPGITALSFCVLGILFASPPLSSALTAGARPLLGRLGHPRSRSGRCPSRGLRNGLGWLELSLAEG